MLRAKDFYVDDPEGLRCYCTWRRECFSELHHAHTLIEPDDSENANGSTVNLSCNDGEQNQGEFDVDCGGAACDPCPCTESEAATCHARAGCSGTTDETAIPTGDVVLAGVTKVGEGRYECWCAAEELGHGWGPDGCTPKGWVVRLVYNTTGASRLSEPDESTLLHLLGVECQFGARAGCDHVHYQPHPAYLGVNVLFSGSAEGMTAAQQAAQIFNTALASQAGSSTRRSSTVPAQVDPNVGARVYAWDADRVAGPIQVPPSGMKLRQVRSEVPCASNFCWVLSVVYTTGSNDESVDTFSTFLLPYAVGSESLSYDHDYAQNGVSETFQAESFPCGVSDYVAFDGIVASLPSEATACCFGTAFDLDRDELGGDGFGTGVLGRYRATTEFASYAATVYPQLCPGGIHSPDIDDESGTARTPKPMDRMPDGIKAGHFRAGDFLAVGQQFVGMPMSPGVTASRAQDAFLGQYEVTIKLDEGELRRKAGMLKGTVGIEHSVDVFLGFANFRPTTTWILDSMVTLASVHVERTGFFTVSSHGVNEYTFLEYVNLRLVSTFVNPTEELKMRTNQTADYVQLTFTLGAQYSVNTNEGLIPLESVRAGQGTFFEEVDSRGAMQHKCVQYTSRPGGQFATHTVISQFNTTLSQLCAPAAAMCKSPSSIPDGFVSFNIPLGLDVFGATSLLPDKTVFVDLVISAVDTEARAAMTVPGSGGEPWQMKTSLAASVPVVEGAVNIFCDSLTARTDLKDVADVDIVVGTATDETELSRLRIIADVARTKLDTQAEVVIDSDSLEAGLITLVLKGTLRVEH